MILSRLFSTSAPKLAPDVAAATAANYLTIGHVGKLLTAAGLIGGGVLWVHSTVSHLLWELGLTVQVTAGTTDVLADLKALRNEIVTMRSDMDNKFGRIDTKIESVRSELNSNHQQLATKVDAIKDQVASIDKRLAVRETKDGVSASCTVVTFIDSIGLTTFLPRPP